MAKGKKTGGRKKGVPNKSTAIREAEIAASGMTPMQYFMGILRADPPKLPADASESDRAFLLGKWEDSRFDAAKELMPYCHARLASVEANMNVSAHESLLDRVAQAEENGTL